MLNKVCRTWFFWAAISAFALAVITCLVFVDDAEAATWKKSGDDLVSGSSRIYYSMIDPYNFDGSHKVTFIIYKKTKNGSPKKICSVKARDINLCGYYKKKLYYSTDASGSFSGSLYVYKEKTKKKKRLIKYGYHFEIKGKYLIGVPNSGSWGPMELYSVNMSTAKAKRISSYAVGYRIRGSKIYYMKTAKPKRGSINPYNVRVMKCNLSGSKRKAVSKSYSARYFGLIDSHSAEYSYEYPNGDSVYRTIRF